MANLKRERKEALAIAKWHPNLRKNYRKARFRKAAGRADLICWKFEMDIPVQEWETWRNEPWVY